MLLAPRRLDLFAERPCAELHLGRRAATGAAPSVLALDHPTYSNTYCASILTRLSSVYRAGAAFPGSRIPRDWSAFMPSIPISTGRSEENTSEIQSLMRNADAVFCLKKQTIQQL